MPPRIRINCACGQILITNGIPVDGTALVCAYCLRAGVMDGGVLTRPTFMLLLHPGLMGFLLQQRDELKAMRN